MKFCCRKCVEGIVYEMRKVRINKFTEKMDSSECSDIFTVGYTFGFLYGGLDI